MSRWNNIVIILVISLLAFIALAAFVVQSATPVQIAIEARFIVTSRDTALWDPGFHEFDIEGDGNLTSPIKQVFSINGNGSVYYEMTDPTSMYYPYPPGPMTGSINFTGLIGDSTWGGLGFANPISGPIELNVPEFSAETLQIIENIPPQYLRLERLFELWVWGYLEAYWDPTPFNVTDGDFSIYFRQISGDGKTFEIDVNGTATAFPSEEPEPIPEIPLAIGMVLITPVVAYRIRWDLKH
jgi:hypothetical protein